MSKKKRGRSLRRRYGHFGTEDIKRGVSSLRKLSNVHPAVTAAAVGAATGAVASGVGAAGAAVLGAAAGIAVQQATKGHGSSGQG
jgi:hypothetical protein